MRLSGNLTQTVLIIEYDGGQYHGFQLQAGEPTIQGELERALKKLSGDRTRVVAASRTDAGVHALGQVVSFRTSSQLGPETFVGGLNYYLPRDIAVRAAHRVGDTFNVRRDAVSREYSYYMLNSRTRSPMRRCFSYQVGGELDISAMNQACQRLIGEHDFSSFASAVGLEVKRTIRRVYRARVDKEGQMVVFNMVANSFLPHQVRNTVGALIRVGLRKMTASQFHSIMEVRKAGLAGPVAPAHGLCLVRVNYREPF